MVAFIYGSKDPVSGRKAATVYISPNFTIFIEKSITGHMSVYAAEFIAVMVALKWV